jgi:hypothetical protein
MPRSHLSLFEEAAGLYGGSGLTSSPCYLCVTESCCGRLFHSLLLLSPLGARSILRANRAFLCAISRSGPPKPTANEASFACAFDAIAAACAELVGLSQSGLKDDPLPMRETLDLCSGIFSHNNVVPYRPSTTKRASFCAARSSRCIPLLPHGSFDAKLAYCAAPWCDAPNARLSHRRCGVDPSGRAWAAPLETLGGCSARAVQW